MKHRAAILAPLNRREGLLEAGGEFSVVVLPVAPDGFGQIGAYCRNPLRALACSQRIPLAYPRNDRSELQVLGSALQRCEGGRLPVAEKKTPGDRAVRGDPREQLVMVRMRGIGVDAPLRQIDDWSLNAMTRIDDPHTIDFLAFAIDRPEEVIASAMLVANANFDTAEVALVISPVTKSRGISWTLLDHVSDYAAAHGVRTLRANHCGPDSRATALEREAGFRLRRDPDDLTVIVAEKQLAPQPAGAA